MEEEGNRWMGSSVDHVYQKQTRPVANSSIVDVKRGTEDVVNVSRHFSALPLATVVDCVLKNDIEKLHSYYP